MLKMAIIGAGTWGESHASIYAEHPQAECVAICDKNRERADAFAAKHRLAHTYYDYREMLEKCDCDAVAIVTPDSAPIKRLIQESRERGMLIDATYGRRTRAVIVMDSDHVILSAIQPETIAARLAGSNAPAEEETEDE